MTPRPGPAGPWRVVVTPPVQLSGWKPKEWFRDHEELTAAFRQLDDEGYDPVFTQLHGDRIVIACRKR